MSAPAEIAPRDRVVPALDIRSNHLFSQMLVYFMGECRILKIEENTSQHINYRQISDAINRRTERLIKEGKRPADIFFDPRLNKSPERMSKSIEELAHMNARYVSISGGLARVTIEAAVKAAHDSAEQTDIVVFPLLPEVSAEECKALHGKWPAEYVQYEAERSGKLPASGRLCLI
jgi:orotidine-5'-phosphate decarboxylase